jgi:DNA topoisomerase-1
MSTRITRIKTLLESLYGEIEANEAAKAPTATKTPGGPPPWYRELQIKYGLSAVPKDAKGNPLPQDQVKVDTSSPETHWILWWRDPKTGGAKQSYAKAFHDLSSKGKFLRTSKLTPELASNVKTIIDKVLMRHSNDRDKQAAAIVGIMAATGLRVGNWRSAENKSHLGVTTLGPKNFNISGNTIMLEFIGKSGQLNTATIVDGTLADYLQTRVASKQNEQFVFDLPEYVVQKFWKEVLNMKKFKVKDLRTHNAAVLAKEILASDSMPPPPLPKDPKLIKRQVKAKISHVFDLVSQKLNNTAAMARKSYIDERIINDWLDKWGVEKHKSLGIKMENEFEFEEGDINLSEGWDDSGPTGFDGDAPLYKLPDWWDDDNIELVPIS